MADSAFNTNASNIHVNVNPIPPVPVKEPFAIKVMRLPSPAFQSHTPLTWRLDSHLGAGSTTSTASSLATPFALSPLLLLPTNIGTVYLGETFRACVSVWQQSSSATFQSVGIKLELQTSSRRWTLVDSTPSHLQFAMSSGETKDLFVSHNLAELGVNCLVCLVSYKDELGERKTFQKFFKFHVHDPFAIHTTIHAREGSMLLAEVTLSSLVNRTVYLTRVQFEASDPRMIVEDLNNAIAAGDNNNAILPESTNDGDKAAADKEGRVRGSSIDGTTSSVGFILPGQSSRTFLFRFISPSQASTALANAAAIQANPLANTNAPNVTPTAAAAAAAAQSPNDPLLGRLQIRWSSLNGENGRIKSSSISRTVKSIVGVEFHLISAPASALIEEVFTVESIVKNGTATRVNAVLQFQKERMGTLLPVGPLIQQLGQIEAGQVVKYPFQLVGVGLGVQKICGIRISFTPAAAAASTATTAGTAAAVAPQNTAILSQEFDQLHQMEIRARE